MKAYFLRRSINQSALFVVLSLVSASVALAAERSVHLSIPSGQSMVACLSALPGAQAGEPYADMLEALCSEIAAKLPQCDNAAHKSIVEAKNAKARVEAVRKVPELDRFLAGDTLDAKLARFFVLNEATPAAIRGGHGQDLGQISPGAGSPVDGAKPAGGQRTM